MNPSKPVRIIPLNSSSLAKLSCETRYAYPVFRGLHTKPNEFSTFGVAFHEFCKQYNLSSPSTIQALKIAEQFKLPADQRTSFLGACTGRDRFVLGQNILREYQFAIPLWQRESPRGTIVQLTLMGTIDDISILDRQIIISDYKTKRTPYFDKAIAEYENGVQLSLYHYVVKKYGHRFIPAEHYALIGDGKSFARYVMIMLSRPIPEWKSGPLTELTPIKMALFEESISCTAEKVFEMFCAFEENSMAGLHRDGWINNICPDCEYAGICHAKSDFERNLAVGQLTEYVYDPHNYPHEVEQ